MSFHIFSLFQFSLSCLNPQEEPLIPQEISCDGLDNQGVEWSTSASKISAWAYLSEQYINDESSKDRLDFSIYPSVDEEGNNITGDALVSSIGMRSERSTITKEE
jgi:hypothetical protein